MRWDTMRLDNKTEMKQLEDDFWLLTPPSEARRGYTKS